MDSVSTPDRNGIGGTLLLYFWRAGTIGAGIIALVCGLLYTKQESLLYFPEIGGLPRRTDDNPRGYRSPSEYNIPYESHMIRCEDGVSIHSWLLLHPESKVAKKPTIIFFHGNAGNIGTRLPNARQMYTNLNANILMVEYRGYGNSDVVKPTEAGLKLDSEAALNFILGHAEIDPDRVFVFGRSLGGAVTFHLASYAESNDLAIAGIIVENTFLSISKMVDHLFPIIAPLKSLLLRIGWNSDAIAPVIKVPVLYLAGDSDDLVPHFHMKNLYKISSKSSAFAHMHVVRGGTHNDTWYKGGREYYEKTNTFISHVILQHDRSLHREECNDLRSDQADNWMTTPKSSIAVGMGTEADKGGVEINSIPIMPSSLVGIAKEASASAISTETKDKKKVN